MFEYVRKHNKIMMVMLFLVVVPSFVMVGISGYDRLRDHEKTVAHVGRVDISQSEWDAAHRKQMERVRQIMPDVDPKLLDSEAARYSSLERLVSEQLVAQAARDARLSVSNARLAQEIQTIPAIAALRRPDGSLDMERYRQLLGSQGMTPEMFEASVRDEMASQQVQAGIQRTGFVTTTDADLALDAYHERREVQLARFATQDYVARVKPTDAELQAYYEANQAQFRAPEQADIEYLVLDIAAVRNTIRLNEQDVRSYYEQNIDRLSGPEERRASHILISVGKDAPAAQREAARKRAEELLAQLRKKPDSFAELARKYSQDPGSARKGGDLDYFSRGAMVKPFEDAVFGLKHKGDISDVVESDFGYHIIRLTGIKAPKRKSFEELRASIENDLKDQQARTRFAEAAEAFTNGVYEQSDSLKPVADKLKLEIHTAKGVQREPLPGATGALASPKFLAAVFSDDAVKNKRNTEAVEIGANSLAAARITHYAPARTMAFDEVRDLVRTRLVDAKAAELARQEGERQLAAWKGKPDSARVGAPKVVSRDQAQELPHALLDAVLRADPAHLPAVVGVDLGAQGYAIARVNKRLPQENAQPAARQRDRDQYVQWWSQAETQAYLHMLRDRYKVEILVPRPAAGGAS